MRGKDVIGALRKVRRVTNGWTACCPAHDDEHPSLSITETPERDLFKCHAGCTFEQIRCAIESSLPIADGLRANVHAGLTVEQQSRIGPRRRRTVAEYDYKDENGRLLFKIVRMLATNEGGSSKKEFHVKRPPRAGEKPSRSGWIHNAQDTRLVLYGLPELANSNFVYLVEGEKDVETLRRLGLTATCNPFGAGKWRSEYNDSLTRKKVAIIPDNDDAGKKHAEVVAGALFGVAKEVVVLELPGLREKEDVTDFIEKGGTVDDLMELASRAAPWIPASGTTRSGKNSSYSFRSLNQILSEPEELISFVWDDTLPLGGFSIFSSKPKVGKSTTVRNLVVAVARGESFLGRRTLRGKVLYLCLEEKRSEVRKHFERMKATGDDILIHTGGSPENAVEKLRDAIVEFRPVLVVIDPLSRVLRAADFNDYAGMSRALEPFIDLARETGTHVLALHHDSKVDRAGGDSILGSTALFAAVDCHIQMKIRENRRVLSTTQRYGEDLPETVIDFDKETGRVCDRGDWKEVVNDMVKAEILRQMDSGTRYRQRHLKELITGRANGFISKALRDLVEEGAVIRIGLGTKASPFEYVKKHAGESG